MARIMGVAGEVGIKKSRDFWKVREINELEERCGWICPRFELYAPPPPPSAGRISNFCAVGALTHCHGMDPGYSFLAALEREFRDDA
jgi:hypothetical protein